jgi:hypothetical protein
MGNVINAVDPSGLCPAFGEEAKECWFPRDQLRRNGIFVVYQQNARDPYECVDKNIRQPGIQQRFTLKEMQAIANAFIIFEKSRDTLNFEKMYDWPLEKPIYIEKIAMGCIFGDAKYVDADYNDVRLISLSDGAWGERNQKTGCNPNLVVDDWEQYRAWMVLHEFGHIFLKDRLLASRANVTLRGNLQLEADSTVPSLMVSAGFGRERGVTSIYHFPPKEMLVEALTGTLWNSGFDAIPGFDENFSFR